MSGHSKWHNIRVKKMASDAKRGKVYTRHAKLIEIAAQKGGEPSMNPSLRTAIENARADNVPVANIERAIKKGTGELKGNRMEEETYAAYGPGGVAFLIEALTDNKNRTLSNLRMNLDKNGGSFADSGAVMWMFARKGVVSGQGTVVSGHIPEELELQLIDAGAEDIAIDGDMITVTTDAGSWTKARDVLAKAGFTILEAGMKFVPTQKTAVSDQAIADKIDKLIEAVEADDDVSAVHTNAEIEL